jgi:hypothetical protein
MRSGTGTISGRAEATGLPGTILLSVASSMVWALLAYELVGATAGGRAIWGGACSPRPSSEPSWAFQSGDSDCALESHIVRGYSFRGGKIVRVRNFYDTAAYERSLGD